MDKIVCFGKNYQEHMLELGDAPVTKPVIFLKPASTLKQCPSWNDEIDLILTQEETHYECELVIQLKAGGYNMTDSEAINALDSYTIGLDMTLRKLQTELKQNGHPWTSAKVFPDAAVIGPWLKINDLDFLDLEFNFSLDGQIRQHGMGNQMLFSPIDLIKYASQHFLLCPGDILFTGTPAGVGMVKRGSRGKLSLGKNNYLVNWVL